MNSSVLFAGYDIGTTSSKVSVVDAEGHVITNAKVNHPQEFSEDGFPEQDAQNWWEDFKKLTSIVGKEISLSRIEAIGLSSMCPCVLPVSDEGIPLRKSLMYGIDHRASKEVELLNESFSREKNRSIYTDYSSQSILPKLLWLRENQPAIFKSTSRILTANGYIGFKLTQSFAMDYFSASAGNLIDLDSLELFEEPFDHFDLSTSLVPEMKWALEPIGNLTRRASLETGLKEGITIFTGTGDACADAITNACIEPGSVSVSLGGTSIFIQSLEKPVWSPDLFVETGATPGSFTIGGATSCGGLLTDWIAERLFGLKGSEKEVLLRDFDVKKYRPSNLILLPFFGGARTPFNDPKAKGIFFGLSMETDRESILSALFESIAIDISMISDEIKRTALEPGQICASGGGTRSEVLLRLIATVLDRELLVCPQEYDSASGAGLIALSAFSESSLSEVVNKIKERYVVVEPWSDLREYMFERKEAFKELYNCNRDLFVKR
jgi:xylulokinase